MQAGMKRRAFISLLAVWPAVRSFAASAQTGRMQRIGILMLGNPDPTPFLREFGDAMRSMGYAEGANLALELRNANGQPDRLPTLARELVASNVDVIVGFQTPAVVAAKAATSEIPIVMCPAQEPVEMGFVESFARPGRNITGVTTATAEIAAKNLDLIREALPSVRRLAAIGNAVDPFHKAFLESIKAAAPRLGFELNTMLVSAAELDAAFSDLARNRVEAVLIQPSLPREQATAIALGLGLPLIAPNAEVADAGGLMAYSAEPLSVYREAAAFADKILKGRKPADLPVQLSTRFLLVVNLKTAAAIGIKLPPALLIRADRVIE
jgi:putative ABC transport system substrate-binding protein